MPKTLGQLMRSASLAETSGEALDQALSWVVEKLDADRCTLFRCEGDSGGFRWIASKGQAGTTPVGPISLVARRREPVLLGPEQENPGKDASKQLSTHGFGAWIGVPVIRFGKVAAVLEILRVPASAFGDEDAALLLTLCAHLAGWLGAADTDGVRREGSGQRLLSGTPAAPGVIVGMAVVWGSADDLDALPDKRIEDTEAEIEDFRSAVGAVRVELQGDRLQMSDRLPGDVTALYDVYGMLLEDRDFLEDVERGIRAGQWAPAALRDAVRGVVRHFDAMADPYLRQRAEDIRSLGRRILLQLSSGLRNPGVYPERAVLVGDEVGLPRMGGADSGGPGGLVCAQGSVLSHSVIVARALGIPAVIGVQELPLEHCQGREIVVDGYRGHVILDPTPRVKAQFERLAREEDALADDLAALISLPARTPDGCDIALQANIALLNETGVALSHGAEGVGLYRSEMPFLLRESLPSEEAQFEVYRELLAAFAPRPVTIRTLDAGGDKALPYLPSAEANPALGKRGLRLTLDHPDIFLMQIRALLRANAGLGNLCLLLPMVTLPEEVRRARALIEQARLSLREEGIDVQPPPLGLMLEVPAAVLKAGALASLVDFVSIGSNDLIQFIQAADRSNPSVTALCDPLAPAVIEAIGMAVGRVRPHRKPVGVCGEMAGDPLSALLLLGLGVDSLSMSPRAIPRVKQVVRSFDSGRARDLWELALASPDAEQTRAMLVAALEAAGLEGLVRAGR